jgi:hypothetical protein
MEGVWASSSRLVAASCGNSHLQGPGRRKEGRLASWLASLQRLARGAAGQRRDPFGAQHPQAVPPRNASPQQTIHTAPPVPGEVCPLPEQRRSGSPAPAAAARAQGGCSHERCCWRNRSRLSGALPPHRAAELQLVPCLSRGWEARLQGGGWRRPAQAPIGARCSKADAQGGGADSGARARPGSARSLPSCNQAACRSPLARWVEITARCSRGSRGGAGGWAVQGWPIEGSRRIGTVRGVWSQCLWKRCGWV